MTIPSGIGPLDARIGGFRAGGLYVLGGAPGAGKMPFLLQFLSAGLDADERLGLLAGYSPEEVFEQARHWGLAELERAWRDGRFVLLGFRGEFPRRVLQAASPRDAFDELTDLLDGPVSRLGVDPGTLLWETRAGTVLARAFLDWHRATGVTLLATATAGPDESVPPPTEWVLQKSTGVFHLARSSNGLRELTVRRLSPPPSEPSPIALELVEGAGLVAPAGHHAPGTIDLKQATRRRLLLSSLATDIQEDVLAWLQREYEVEEIRDPLQVIARLQSGPHSGLCITVERSQVERAIDLCRVARPHTGGAIVVLSRGQLRSSDRARAMEAGADDVLRQDVVLRELQSRFRRAAACMRGYRDQETTDARPQPIWDLLDRERLAEEVRSRLASPAHGYLTLIVVPESVGGQVSQALLSSLRVEAGDFMGHAPGGFAVVLQDARQRHALVFLERALHALDFRSGAPEVRILTSPEEAEEIRAAIGS